MAASVRAAQRHSPALRHTADASIVLELTRNPRGTNQQFTGPSKYRLTPPVLGGWIIDFSGGRLTRLLSSHCSEWEYPSKKARASWGGLAFPTGCAGLGPAWNWVAPGEQLPDSPSGLRLAESALTQTGCSTETQKLQAC
ncbi:hypothetical protein NDU88_002740 [Pleurodeles waltl]|uniref:Uncharacterized protein n=1 Tax=Pleurodeles waltl TaxID=8319 RepID=A0AAV7V0J5_PLEWA|nr:hypothetical protein NDU88_002740 [Pleurodeles waltl]